VTTAEEQRVDCELLPDIRTTLDGRTVLITDRALVWRHPAPGAKDQRPYRVVVGRIERIAKAPA